MLISLSEVQDQRHTPQLFRLGHIGGLVTLQLQEISFKVGLFKHSPLSAVVWRTLCPRKALSVTASLR